MSAQTPFNSKIERFLRFPGRPIQSARAPKKLEVSFARALNRVPFGLACRELAPANQRRATTTSALNSKQAADLPKGASSTARQPIACSAARLILDSRHDDPVCGVTDSTADESSCGPCASQQSYCDCWMISPGQSVLKREPVLVLWRPESPGTERMLGSCFILWNLPQVSCSCFHLNHGDGSCLWYSGGGDVFGHSPQKQR